MKYKIKKFTKEEVLDMRYRYADWTKPENEFCVVETIEKEIV